MDEFNLEELELDYDEEWHPEEPTAEKRAPSPDPETQAAGSSQSKAPRIKFPTGPEPSQLPLPTPPPRHLSDYRIPLKKQQDRSRSPIARPQQPKPAVPTPVHSRRQQGTQPLPLIHRGSMRVANDTETGWEWHKPCLNSGKHRSCQGITVEDVQQAANTRRAAPALLARQPCPTILHAVFTRWALRQPNHGEAVNFVSQILPQPADRLGIFYEANEQRILNSAGSSLLSDKDISGTIELWTQKCEVARESSQTEPWAPVKTYLQLPPTRLNETTNLLERIAFKIQLAATVIRCRNHFPSATLTNNSTVFLGDTAMGALAGRHRGFSFLTRQGQTLLDAVQSVYLGGPVEQVLIWSGLDQLQLGQPGRQVAEELKQSVNHLRKFEGVSVIVIMPPFVPAAQTEWREVRRQLENMPPQSNLTLLTPNCAQSKAFPTLIESSGFPTDAGLQDTADCLKKTGLELQDKPVPRPKRPRHTTQDPSGPEVYEAITLDDWLDQTSHDNPGPSHQHQRPVDAPKPPSRPSIKARLTQLNLKATLMLLSILTLTTSALEPTKPMVCRHQKDSSLLIRVPKGAFCREAIRPEWTQRLPLDVLRPNTRATEVTALYCLKTRSTATFYTNLLGDHFAQYTNTTEHTTPQECVQMRTREKCQYGRMTGHHTWQTNNRLTIDFPGRIGGLIAGTQTKSQANCAVTSTQIWHRPGEKGVFTAIGDGSQCDWLSGECELPEGGALVWQKPSPDDLCAFISQQGTQEGNLTGAIWQGTNSQLALTFSDPPPTTISCGQTFWVSDQGYALNSTDYRQYRKAQLTRRAKREASLVESEQLSSQLTASQAASNSQLRLSLKELCQEMGKRDRGEATQFARQHLKDSYVQARWASQDLLEVWPCVPVEWHNLRLRPSPPSTCYKFPPVYFDVEEAELEGFLDPSRLILTAGSQKLPCQYARRRVMTWNSEVVEIDQTTATSTAIPEWRVKQAVNPEQEVPNLSPTVFRNLALSNVSDILPVHMVDAALQDLRSRLRTQQEQVNLEASGPYRAPAADDLWAGVMGWLQALKSAWIHSCCAFVTLQLLWTLFLHQLALTLLLDPGRALAQRVYQRWRPTTDQNGEGFPGRRVKREKTSPHYTTTQGEEISLTREEWSFQAGPAEDRSDPNPRPLPPQHWNTSAAYPQLQGTAPDTYDTDSGHSIQLRRTPPKTMK